MAINLCGHHHTCLDSRPHINAYWLITPSQPKVSAELNEANVNISSDVTLKAIFYIKISISDYHSLEVSYYVAAYRLRLFFNAHFFGNCCPEFVLQTLWEISVIDSKVNSPRVWTTTALHFASQMSTCKFFRYSYISEEISLRNYLSMTVFLKKL